MDLESWKVRDLLYQVIRIAKAHRPDTTLEKTFRYPFSSDQKGPSFGVLPPPFVKKLTWQDLSMVAFAILEYYQESQHWVEMAFLIGDSERGTLGSGAVNQGLEQPNLQSGAANASIATS